MAFGVSPLLHELTLGITASSQNDQFHAIFGRDSLWTVLLALEAGRLQQQRIQAEDAARYRRWLHDLAASVLRGLTRLQGTVVNDVNEEQPGRFIHEYWNPVPQRMIEARWPEPMEMAATTGHSMPPFSTW